MKIQIAVVAFVACVAQPLFGQSAAAPASPSTLAELEARTVALFAGYDSNHDGFLTEAELGENGEERVFLLDTDHDGKVSLAEGRASALSWFNRFDTNHDGTISNEERAARLRHEQVEMGETDQSSPVAQPAQEPTRPH